MIIEYSNNKIKKVCTNQTVAQKQYGEKMAEKIFIRIKDIKIYKNINDLIKYSKGRCHQLKGNRKNQYAMDLVHPYRLVFELKNNQIHIVNIIEIVDYH